nr:hypothetical protein [uncultured Arsenicibacter sp.]
MGGDTLAHSSEEILALIEPLVNKTMATIAVTAKRGKPTADDEVILQRLLLLKSAVPYWNEKNLIDIRTYLALTYNV